ncbi:hypothetical protein GCM10022291_07010 [Postechiella marina]|uniref:Uncharacterized protein n=1 Tax=Postechiella marina TaxID=943941 RepID=A0ABP8C355_9FLAO
MYNSPGLANSSLGNIENSFLGKFNSGNGLGKSKLLNLSFKSGLAGNNGLESNESLGALTAGIAKDLFLLSICAFSPKDINNNVKKEK